MTAQSGAIIGSGRRGVFGLLLLTAMAVATFTPIVIGLLASELIDDFNITRAEVGLLIAVTAVVSAITSPTAGRITDAIGGRTSAAALFVAGAMGFLLMAASNIYSLMFVAVVVSGLAQAGANPSTNKLIAQHVAVGKRGTITGIKQSGVQIGVFLGGLLVPLGADTIGWRPTLVVVAIVPIAALPLLYLTVPGDRPERKRDRRAPVAALPSAARWLAAYGTLLGFGGAVTFLIPLFVEESLFLSARVGGAAAAVVGLSAVVGRLGWARIAERGERYAASLLWIAVLSLGALAALFASTSVGPWLMWVGAAAIGLTASSWNAVGMLAVMASAGHGLAGRASGFVMVGFLTGLGVGPPIYGWTIDRTHSYTIMWVMALLSMAGAAVIAIAWLRSSGGDQAHAAFTEA